jgi:SAM-dependent methyltransferase
MTTAHAGTAGHVPTVTVGAGNPEAQKYGKLWGEFPQYRQVAPGEHVADAFFAQAKPLPGSTVIDFGCGTGRGALALAQRGQLDVTMLDFAGNCLDEAVREACENPALKLRFRKHDLETPSPVTAEYGYCTDVLEHVPPDKVDQVLDHIFNATRHTFFQISTVEDVCGDLIGAPLHLSVHPYEWWLMRFAKRGCVIHWSSEDSSSVLFYVSSWKDVKIVTKQGQLNVTNEEIRANAAVNCAAGWEQVVPHPENDMEVMILGGGPSLNQHFDEICRLRAAGVKLITLKDRKRVV